MSANHTPGPWINDDGLILPSGFDDADDSRYQAWIADLRAASNSEANARLIAAAPELLAALRDMVHYDDLPAAEQAPAIARARAALAKVR